VQVANLIIMSPPLYFGVELEFCLAYILPGMKNYDHGSDKSIEFTIPNRSVSTMLRDTTLREQNKSRVKLSQLLDTGYNSWAAEKLRHKFVLAAAREHIGQAFLDAVLPYQRGGNRLGSLDYWAIGKDKSINTDHCDPKQFWFPMEITSPAYLLNDKSLKEVDTVCQILTEKYRTDINPSCALHVHFSFGRKASEDDESTRWSFNRLKKLMMFFWACSPYFTALHPAIYPDNPEWALPIRTTSQLAKELHSRNDGQPTEDWWLVL
jgi:hypothetical protein